MRIKLIELLGTLGTFLGIALSIFVSSTNPLRFELAAIIASLVGFALITYVILVFGFDVENSRGFRVVYFATTINLSASFSLLISLTEVFYLSSVYFWAIYVSYLAYTGLFEVALFVRPKHLRGMP